MEMLELNTIEETIKLAGFGRKRVMKKQIKLMKKDLSGDEELLGVAASFPKPLEHIYITSKQVIIHKIEGMFENNKVEIPISTIKSVKVKDKELGAEIKVTAPNNSATVEKVPLYMAKEIKQLIDTKRRGT